ncbi:MAG: alpha/beta hydrolase [Sinobacteraceae bacterium]|nr:alpha/beta hydrolase [Nevskiaceae bacterium]
MSGNNKFSGVGGTRGLVAPELLRGLDYLPSFDFTEEILRGIRSSTGTGIALPNQPALAPELAAVACEQRFVPGPAGAPDVRVLVYTPAARSGAKRPAVLHAHGGGYVLGNPEISDSANRAFVADLGCIIVSVDYRLAPETRYPGSLEDCYAALRWLHTQAEQLGVDRTRIAIAGESAGGGHAAALVQLAHRRGEFAVCFQLLDSAMLDDRTGSVSDPRPHPYCGEFVWTATSNRFGWRSLLGVEPGGPDVPVDAVPARAADLRGLPPAFISVGALDLFLEENLEYARRLIHAGVPTELHVIPGAYHGFSIAGGDAPQVQTHLRLRRDALGRALTLG